MLRREHSAILSTCIKVTFVFKIFDLSNFECPLKKGFTVYAMNTEISFSSMVLIRVYTLSKICNWSPYIFYASFESKSQ